MVMYCHGIEGQATDEAFKALQELTFGYLSFKTFYKYTEGKEWNKKKTQ